MSGGGDPFWTYQRVSWALRNYHDLVAGARPPRNPALPPPPPPRLRAVLDPHEYEVARILADLDRALSVLAVERPDWYRAIAAVYLDPDRHWQRLSVNARVLVVSSNYQCTARTVWRILSRAKQAIVSILSGQELPE